MRLAEIYLELGFLADFQKALNNVIYTNDERLNHPIIMNRVALAYEKNGQKNKALEITKMFVKRCPEVKSGHLHLARLLRKSGELKEAEKELSIADSLSRMFPLETVDNYRNILSMVSSHGASVLVMEYPMRDLRALKEMLLPDAESSTTVKFFSNKEYMEDAVRKYGYDALFIDRFGGDFGHPNTQGYRLMGKKISEALLTNFEFLRAHCGVKAAI